MQLSSMSMYPGAQQLSQRLQEEETEKREHELALEKEIRLLEEETEKGNTN